MPKICTICKEICTICKKKNHKLCLKMQNLIILIYNMHNMQFFSRICCFIIICKKYAKNMQKICKNLNAVYANHAMPPICKICTRDFTNGTGTVTMITRSYLATVTQPWSHESDPGWQGPTRRPRPAGTVSGMLPQCLAVIIRVRGT